MASMAHTHFTEPFGAELVNNGLPFASVGSFELELPRATV